MFSFNCLEAENRLFWNFILYSKEITQKSISIYHPCKRCQNIWNMTFRFSLRHVEIGNKLFAWNVVRQGCKNSISYFDIFCSLPVAKKQLRGVVWWVNMIEITQKRWSRGNSGVSGAPESWTLALTTHQPTSSFSRHILGKDRRLSHCGIWVLAICVNKHDFGNQVPQLFKLAPKTKQPG